MPERLARTDPFQQVTETVGSGPFKFVRKSSNPATRRSMSRNTDYVPRDEPPSWASGQGCQGRPGGVALICLNTPPPPSAWRRRTRTGGKRLRSTSFRLLSANPDVTVEKTDPLGSTTMLRFNHLHPPFNNVKMRQAILAVTDQADFMNALAGDPKNWNLCPSFFTCGTPMRTTLVRRR